MIQNPDGTYRPGPGERWEDLLPPKPVEPAPKPTKEPPMTPARAQSLAYTLTGLAILPLFSLFLALGCGQKGGQPIPPRVAQPSAPHTDLTSSDLTSGGDLDSGTQPISPEGGSSFLAPSAPGSGYTPTSLTTHYRLIPGGPEQHSIGSLSANPWEVNCRGKSGPTLLECLHSRFLTGSAEVCAAYLTAFGVGTCGTPGGGWTRGPSNERWGSAKQALDYFCIHDPSVINSTGAAGGWDCNSTAYEWAALGAFGGEGIVTEWERRVGDDNSPPTPCVAPKVCIDPPTPCPDCPPPVECDSCCAECPPPVKVTLTPRTVGALKAVCSQISSNRPQQRRRCREAVEEVFGKVGLGVNVSGGSTIDPVGRSAGSALDPWGVRVAGGSAIDPIGKPSYRCTRPFKQHPGAFNCEQVGAGARSR